MACDSVVQTEIPSLKVTTPGPGLQVTYFTISTGLTLHALPSTKVGTLPLA